MLKMDSAALRKALEQLHQATRDHTEWQRSRIRAIVRGPSGDRDGRADGAQAGCRFDQAYFERLPAAFWGQPAFAALGMEHARLHRLAAQLLEGIPTDGPFVPGDLELLAAETARLHRKLDSLRQELQGALQDRDALTGAGGRAGMLPELRAWHDLAKRQVQPCCIVLMGLDRLAEINAGHGHPAGDAVLAGAVRRVCSHLRPYDRMYRYGGDEFLIALAGTDLGIGQAVIKRAREGLASRPVAAGPGGVPLQVTASFGLAALDPEVAVEESVERAEQALVLAKTAGRNRAINWDPAVTTGTRLPRLQIEDAKA